MLPYFILLPYYIIFPSNELSITFKILLFLVIPLAANANLCKERIDALLVAEVYHHDPSKARDLDSICTAEAMQCLVGYNLRLSFSNPNFIATIRLAKEKIAQLEFSVNDQLDIATKK